MNEDEKNIIIKCLAELLTFIVGIGLGLLMCALLSGCKTVERESVVIKSDTLHHYTERRDSVVYRDSVFVHLYEKGDTIYSITERWNVQYRDRVKIDTVYRTVYVSQKEKEEKKAPWYERYMSWVWAVAVVGCFMFGMWCQKKK